VNRTDGLLAHQNICSRPPLSDISTGVGGRTSQVKSAS
jgi:hypothetical protein